MYTTHLIISAFVAANVVFAVPVAMERSSSRLGEMKSRSILNEEDITGNLGSLPIPRQVRRRGSRFNSAERAVALLSRQQSTTVIDPAVDAQPTGLGSLVDNADSAGTDSDVINPSSTPDAAQGQGFDIGSLLGDSGSTSILTDTTGDQTGGQQQQPDLSSIFGTVGATNGDGNTQPGFTGGQPSPADLSPANSSTTSPPLDVGSLILSLFGGDSSGLGSLLSGGTNGTNTADSAQPPSILSIIGSLLRGGMDDGPSSPADDTSLVPSFTLPGKGADTPSSAFDSLAEASAVGEPVIGSGEDTQEDSSTSTSAESVQADATQTEDVVEAIPTEVGDVAIDVVEIEATSSAPASPTS